jgi:alpha-mannosidase
MSATGLVNGARAQVTQVYQIGSSELVQQIVLVAGSARIEFQTAARWREPRSMLRTSFPVAIQAEAATYDIQFGHIRRPTHRNTTWDLARDEVAAHKWVDLSQRDYGVALLNDSKYGHKVKGNVLDLNLLRSVPYPGPRIAADASGADGADGGVSDLAEHSFVYALYPHLGDHVEGGVVQAGYALNVPLRTVATSAHPGDLPPSGALVRVGAPNVVVEAVKLAEAGRDLIIRLYEAEQRGVTATVRFAFPFASAAEVNLLEEPLGPLDVAESAVTLVFRPFEIKTLRVAVSGQ